MTKTEGETFRVRDHGRAMLGHPLFTYDEAIGVIRANFAEASFGGDASVEFAFVHTHGNILTLLSDGGVMTKGGKIIPMNQHDSDPLYEKLVRELDRVKTIRGTHHQICTRFGLPKMSDLSTKKPLGDAATLTFVARRALEFMRIEQEDGRIVVSPPGLQPYYFNELFDLATNIAQHGFELGNVEKPYLLSVASVGKLAALSVIHEFGAMPQKDLTYEDIYGKQT